MSDKKIFIADGHHRYDTACNFKDEANKAAGGKLPEHDPLNFVLMMCIGMDDPGLLVLPTHRLFRGLSAMTAPELQAKLKPYFDVRTAGEGSAYASTVWEEIETADEQGSVGVARGAANMRIMVPVQPRRRPPNSRCAASATG
jgi:uncharacterized protein (DUF1015 family)